MQPNVAMFSMNKMGDTGKASHRVSNDAEPPDLEKDVFAAPLKMLCFFGLLPLPPNANILIKYGISFVYLFHLFGGLMGFFIQLSLTYIQALYSSKTEQPNFIV
jgi:hypothetical protein